jgi:lysophospholipase L1-like esterase
MAVELASATDRLETDGLVIDGVKLTTKRFGGLVGLDGIHFTDTGYALMATAFALKVAEVTGQALPELDIQTQCRVRQG